MHQIKLRTKSGIIIAMLFGAGLSIVPSQGGRIQQGAYAKEASTSKDARLAEESEARIKELRERLPDYSRARSPMEQRRPNHAR